MPSKEYELKRKQARVTSATSAIATWAHAPLIVAVGRGLYCISALPFAVTWRDPAPTPSRLRQWASWWAGRPDTFCLAGMVTLAEAASSPALSG